MPVKTKAIYCLEPLNHRPQVLSARCGMWATLMLWLCVVHYYMYT